MARHPKQNEYERNAANRQMLRIQAAMFGWSALDTLSAFLTPDGEVIVIDKALNRYATTAEAEKLLAPVEAEAAIVAPADRPADTFGPRWQKARQGMADALADGGLLDLSVQGHDSALSAAETVAASFLRLVQVLRENNGPDWREQIGLSDV